MATLSRMMNKAASSVFPLAIRRTPSYGNYTPWIRTTQLKTSTSIRSIGTSSSTDLSGHLSHATPVSAHYPTTVESNSDGTLLRNIQSEIDRLEEEFKVPEAPEEFPFKIVDCERIVDADFEDDREKIILTGRHLDDQIEVTVRAAGGYPRSLDLVVSVKKINGSTLEFEVKADEADGFTIESWAFKNSNYPDEVGPDFSDIDWQLRKNFYTYLEDRGIKPSITTFLCDYMDHKQEKYDDDYEDEEEKLLWWKKLKNFLM